jgi:hypothetical protein
MKHAEHSDALELNLEQLLDEEHLTNKKKKSLKNSKPSTTKECYTKILPQQAGWFSWREKPMSEAYLHALCEKLLLWAQTDNDAYDIDEFFEANYIWNWQMHLWAKEHEFVANAITQALRILGTRRHKTAFKRLTDAGIMKLTQHLYKKEWHKDVNQYHSDMKKAEEAEKQELHVHFDEVPASALVTKRKGKK